MNILLVEDNEADVILTERALSQSSASVKLVVRRDGEQALKYLDECSEDSGCGCPDLVLLDLNLPGICGHEVLSRIKKNPKTRRIPVVVLSTSSSEQDIDRSYDIYANTYITKPFEQENYSKLVEVIDKYWFQTARIPART